MNERREVARTKVAREAQVLIPGFTHQRCMTRRSFSTANELIENAAPSVRLVLDGHRSHKQLVRVGHKLKAYTVWSNYQKGYFSQVVARNTRLTERSPAHVSGSPSAATLRLH
jgi:predicted amidophosphoribosyltransferase